jgi:hypothetical protein
MRNSPNAYLATFDAPDGSVSVARRNTTTTSLQSLFLTNSAWMVRNSEGYAKRIISESPSTRLRIEMMFRQILLREPSDEEVRWIEASIEEQGTSDPLGAWSDACQALWNTSEFLYIE